MMAHRNDHQYASRTSEARATQQRDEWVEISSEPSSSSLSSIGDEIITTGLAVGQPRYGSRQRRHARLHSQRSAPAATSATSAHVPAPILPLPVVPAAHSTSSQDEYDETESEDDHFLASSGEKLSVPTTPSRRVIVHTDTDDDEKATTTAFARHLAPDSPPSFTPGPNAFSHPPAAAAVTGDHLPPPACSVPHPHSAVRGNMRNFRRGGGSFMSSELPGTDNDAALRASLTTLLSCAAAARGANHRSNSNSSNTKDHKESGGTRTSPGNQPTQLRLVQEADLMPPVAATQPSTVAKSTSRRQASRGRSAEKSKRRAGGPEARKRPYNGVNEAWPSSSWAAASAGARVISPTLLTWVVSAGVVVVLVSVVGFGAGYVIGREAGRQEGIVGGNLNTTTSGGGGREVLLGKVGSGGALRRMGIVKSVAA